MQCLLFNETKFTLITINYTAFNEVIGLMIIFILIQ